MLAGWWGGLPACCGKWRQEVTGHRNILNFSFPDTWMFQSWLEGWKGSKSHSWFRPIAEVRRLPAGAWGLKGNVWHVFCAGKAADWLPNGKKRKHEKKQKKVYRLQNRAEKGNINCIMWSQDRREERPLCPLHFKWGKNRLNNCNNKIASSHKNTQSQGRANSFADSLNIRAGRI